MGHTSSTLSDFLSNKVALRSWLRTDGCRQVEPLAPANIKLIRDTLRITDNEAVAQRPMPTLASTDTFFPARLIYVGSDTAKDPPRLVKTVGDALPQYAALTYCWGPKQDADRQLVTTTASLQAHLQRLPRAAMTPCMRDTLIVCRTLNITYVWIDAVCIVQDDRDDWARESVKMAHIYYHAHLTICPLVSHSCIQGFLSPRPPGVDIPFRSRRRPEIAWHLTLVEACNDEDVPRAKKMNLQAPTLFAARRLPNPFDLDVLLSVWDTRGWTFQENLCKSRVLCFGKTCLHVINGQICASEIDYVQEYVGQYHAYTELLDLARAASNRSSTFPDACPADASMASRSLTPNVTALRATGPRSISISKWCSLTEVNGREFTQSQDLLPALSGLAHVYNLLHGDVYLAGLWRRYLHVYLLWWILNPRAGTLETTLDQLRREESRVSPYLAPSWSWLRVGVTELCRYVCTVSYDLPPSQQRRHRQRARSGGGHPYPLRQWSDFGPTHMRRAFALTDHTTDLVGINPYGQVRHASLRVYGKMVSLPISVIPEPSDMKYSTFGYLPSGQGSLHVRVFPRHAL